MPTLICMEESKMAKGAQVIAKEINDLMRKNGNECITLKWEQFYEICERERLADVVMDKVEKSLKKNDLHIIYGNNVIIVRDFCWNPVSL